MKRFRATVRAYGEIEVEAEDSWNATEVLAGMSLDEVLENADWTEFDDGAELPQPV